MRPNIFEISTKELTQDGFIRWLLEWADHSNKEYNSTLNRCGVDFVKLLIGKQYNNTIDVKKVEAGRQREKIDIWAEVNDEYYIIIEDKTFTGEHSNQLEIYKKKALKLCKKNGRKLVCIYLKTGTQSKSSLEEIRKKGFATVERFELINLFKDYDIKNDIFIDFVEKINNLENAEKAYETKKIKDWEPDRPWPCWTGFYHFLDDMQIDIDWWGYVSNQSGGFLGYFFHYKYWKKHEVFLQIEGENGTLRFRISDIPKNNRKKVRDEWHGIVM